VPENSNGYRTGKDNKRAHRRRTRTGAAKKLKRISRTRKPEDMSLQAWQVALRREYGRTRNFKLKNLGSDTVFSEFEVTNPASGGTYRVAIRGEGLGENYCSCPDYAVNFLGTCKHIEFTLAKLRRKRGGKAALARGFTPDYSEVFLRYGPRRQIVVRPGKNHSVRFGRLVAGRCDADGVLDPKYYNLVATMVRRERASGFEVRYYDDAATFVARLRDRDRLERRIRKAFPRGASKSAFGRLLGTELYAYQREGALFAARAGRSLIADDMGLGKTVQAIAAAEILRRTAGAERVLVVCPASLKYQWRSEVERFSKRTALVIEGLLSRRRELYAAEADFKIVNYDVVYRDLPAIQAWDPDLVILDEAQRIKNWKTRTARSVKQLGSEFAVVLTGTPLENRLEELHSIVEFVDRHHLGPMYRFLAEHQHTDENGKVIGYRNLSDISRSLHPILIRRTKGEVLKQLPERMDKHLLLPMTNQQMEHHEENREIVARIVGKWRRYGFLSEVDQRRLMIALQNMRMSCNSTYLLDRKTDFGVKADEAITLLSEILERPDSRVVIFSQWLRTHELLSARFEALEWPHVLFHGGIPSRNRGKLVQRFREDPDCRLFLSTDAGSTGLNLQIADTVLNMDQPWNPAVVDQRVGRIHRLGQHKPVRVVHMVSRGTIEEGMLKLLDFKKSMFAGVLDGGEDEVFLGGTRLKRFMESVDNATSGIPAELPVEQPADARANEEVTTEEEQRGDREPSGNRDAKRRSRTRSASSTAGQDGTQAQAFSAFVEAGRSFLDALEATLARPGEDVQGRSKASGAPGLARRSAPLVEHDEQTGRDWLRLPMPDERTVTALTQVLGALLKPPESTEHAR